MKYLGLLRGINVGGNNKVSMSELRACFEEQGFTDVVTYINSGNIFFSSDSLDTVKLVTQCEDTIKDTLGFAVVVMVILVDDLHEALAHAPIWWVNTDKKVIRSDALFIIPPTKPEEVLRHLKRKTTSVDQLSTHGQVIFWSLPMDDYGKSVVPKIIGTPIYRSITMRSSTTTKKLAELANQL